MHAVPAFGGLAFTGTAIDFALVHFFDNYHLFQGTQALTIMSAITIAAPIIWAVVIGMVMAHYFGSKYVAGFFGVATLVLGYYVVLTGGYA